MKKITIIALHLGYGGIEKAIASLANMLCDDYKINIIATYQLYDKPAFNIDKRVKIQYLIKEKPNRKEFLDLLKKMNIPLVFKEGIKSVKTLYLRRKKMISAIKRIDSDVIISTRPFHNALLGKYANKGIVKIAWEHSHHNNNQKYINKLVSSCKNIDYLVSVSQELNEFYANKLKSTNTKCLHIYPALDEYPNESSKLNKKEIVSIGRLSKEKGFTDLVDVFKIVNKSYPDWHLNIVGDGIEKDSIANKIEQAGLSSSITMHGFKDKDELTNIYKNSSIYVMTSLTESFGLVLIEAMSYGIPCVAFDSARGSLEIIDDNINGFIVKNRSKRQMAHRIIALIDSTKLRHSMGNKAFEKSLKFSPEIIRNSWIKLIDNQL